MADNGSTDGAPEEAVYALSQRATAPYRRQPRLRHRRQPRRFRKRIDVLAQTFYRRQPRRAVGTARHRSAARRRHPLASRRLPGTADPRPGRLGVPVGAAPALEIIRGGMHAVVGPLWPSNPWTARVPPGTHGSQRTRGRLAVGFLSVAAHRGFRGGHRIRRALLHVHGRRRPGRSTGTGRLAQRLCALGGGVARQGAFHWPRPRSQSGGPPRQHLHFPRGSIPKRWQAPLRWVFRGALGARSNLVVRNSLKSRRAQAKGRG